MATQLAAGSPTDPRELLCSMATQLAAGSPTDPRELLRDQLTSNAWNISQQTSVQYLLVKVPYIPGL